jgi:hypothetical protein
LDNFCEFQSYQRADKTRPEMIIGNDSTGSNAIPEIFFEYAKDLRIIVLRERV